MRRLMIIILLIVPVLLNAYFENQPVSADGVAGGNIITALDDESAIIHYNPGALARVRKINVGTTFIKNYFGLEMNLAEQMDYLNNYQASAAVPLLGKYGVLGLGFWRMSSYYYAENIYQAGWAYSVLEGLSAGFSSAFYSWGISESKYIELNDYLDAGNGVSAISFSFGLEYSDIKSLTIGAVVQNINQPDVGLVEAENLPLCVRIGATKKFSPLLYFSSGLTLQADFLALAVAYNQDFFNRFLSVKSAIEYSKFKSLPSIYDLDLGFGLNFEFPVLFTFYYTFNYPLNGLYSHYGNHLFSLNVKF